MKKFDKVLITNRLFYGVNGENENNLMKDKVIKNNIEVTKVKYDKLILLLRALYLKTDRTNNVTTSLEDLLNFCGYSTKNKETIKEFKAMLFKLKHDGLINFEGDEFKLKELIHIDVENLTNEDGVNKEFFVIEENEFDKLKELAIVNNVKESNLIMYYYYLKCRTHKRAENSDIHAFGGNAQVTWVGFDKITKDTGVSDNAIDSYNKILVKANMLLIGNLGRMYHKENPKNTQNCGNIYAITILSDDPKYELKEGMKQYSHNIESKGWCICKDKNYKNNDRSKNGLLGRLTRLEKDNKINEEQLKQLNELREENRIVTKEMSQQWQNREYVEELEEGMSISQHLLENDIAGYDKYLRFETSLGLVDDEGELLVSDNQYRYIMTNYTKNEHDKFINIINNYISNNENSSDLWG